MADDLLTNQQQNLQVQIFWPVFGRGEFGDFQLKFFLFEFECFGSSSCWRSSGVEELDTSSLLSSFMSSGLLPPPPPPSELRSELLLHLLVLQLKSLQERTLISS